MVDLIQFDQVKSTRRLFVFGLAIANFIKTILKGTTTKVKSKINKIEDCAQIDFASPIRTRAIQQFVNSQTDFQQLELFVSRKTRGFNFLDSEAEQSQLSPFQTESIFQEQPTSSHIRDFNLEDIQEKNPQQQNKESQRQQPNRIKSQNNKNQNSSEIIIVEQNQKHDQKQYLMIFQDLVKLLLKNPAWSIKDLFEYIKVQYKEDMDEMARIIGIIGHNTTALENIVRINQYDPQGKESQIISSNNQKEKEISLEQLQEMGNSQFHNQLNQLVEVKKEDLK